MISRRGDCMFKSIIKFSILAIALFGLTLSQGHAKTIKLNDPAVLGGLKLSKKQLKAIQKAVLKAEKSPIDAEHQCGAVRLDCVVRAAREWKYQGVTYREIVINVHMVGAASITVEKIKGKWTKIATK